MSLVQIFLFFLVRVLSFIVFRFFLLACCERASERPARFSISSILASKELAIWKTKLEEDDDDDDYSEEPLRKRAKIDHLIVGENISTRKREHRQNCRVNCGAEIVITNILPYLLVKS